LLSGAVGMLLPKRYTATSVLLIDAPAGNDPRSATAVSPVYLESLKTYEQFAASDTLFVRAAERFHLADSGSSVDSLKRQVLKVVKPRDTRLLQIGVTLPDPVKAQAVAQFLAEESTNLNRSLSRQTDDEFALEAQRQVDAAQVRLQAAQRVMADLEKTHPFDSLYAETSGLVELRTRLQRDMADVRADEADGVGNTSPARTVSLQKQIEALDKKIASNEALSSDRRSQSEPAEFELRTARAVRDNALVRLNDIRATAGSRGERLRIIDPGIVPQRPSAPNVPLIVLAAIFIAGVASLIGVTFSFVFQQRARPAPVRVAYR
jgi:tyrosine-protein kinase Etk/Wzc